MLIENTETLTKRVFELICSHVDIPKEQVSLDAHFEVDLGFDSLEIVEFVMSVEDEFGITISDEESGKIITVRDAVQTIQRLLA